MKRFLSFGILLLILGCAPYKQLKPKILLSPAENGYVELKKDAKNLFEIKKNKQYFINFPAPKEDNFYLVISLKKKPAFKDGFTAQLIKKKTVGKRIKDIANKLDTLSVYPIDTKSSNYYWLLENISENQPLSIEYRYVPKWRWKFENYHAEYKLGLEKNRVNRDSYNSIGLKHKFEIFNFEKAIDSVSKHLSELNKIQKELIAIENVFPKSVLNSKDKAYLDYVSLRKSLDEEIEFQKTYIDVMKFFRAEKLTRNDIPMFLENIDLFLNYFDKKNRYSSNVLSASENLIGIRLEELPEFYSRLLKLKTDETVFDTSKFYINSFLKTSELFKKASLTPSKAFQTLDKFIRDFNTKAVKLAEARKKIAKMKKSVSDLKNMPPNNYFSGMASGIDDAVNSIPDIIQTQSPIYSNLVCTKVLNTALLSDKKQFSRLAVRYRQADLVVVQVNPMLSKMYYPEALQIVTQYRDLDFLLPKYIPLDRLSIQSQKERILDALESFRWRESERLLSAFYTDNTYINPSSIFALKKSTVESLEDTLYATIDRVTRYRVFKFLEANLNTVTDVDSLYTNPVFLPCYNVTFTTGTNRELLNRKFRLEQDLAKMKEYEFPRKAVKLLYSQFVKNPNKDGIGVYRARAIVTHGEHYKGNDKKIKRMIAECNPYSSKWIVKPAKYRRVFAMPITTREHGVNTYFFRLNIRIPSDARFPVYDVNIKLPKYLASNAGEKKWYDKILLNKIPLKNEGRFTIGAPVPANGYECQITPVRMKKDKNNFLDVYFKHRSFKVHQISVMVQKPIMKKN